MFRTISLLLTVPLYLYACSPGNSGHESTPDSLTDLANGDALGQKTCRGKYKPFAGVKPSESIFVGFSDQDRFSFDKAATAVPGFVTYLYGVALEGRYVIDKDRTACKGDQPCADFNPAVGEKGQYTIGFKPGEDIISGHLPFASGIAMLNMARVTVVNGNPVMGGYPPNIATEMNAIRNTFVSEVQSDSTNKLSPSDLASLNTMPIDEFIAHGLDSKFCNSSLYAQDRKKFPQTMARIEAFTQGFDEIDAALEAALKANSDISPPAGLSALSAHLFANLKEAYKAVRGSNSLGLTAWGKGGIGGANKVQVGTSPYGRRVFENPVRASGNGIYQSKANRPWVN